MFCACVCFFSHRGYVVDVALSLSLTHTLTHTSAFTSTHSHPRFGQLDSCFVLLFVLLRFASLRFASLGTLRGNRTCARTAGIVTRGIATNRTNAPFRRSLHAGPFPGKRNRGTLAGERTPKTERHHGDKGSARGGTRIARLRQGKHGTHSTAQHAQHNTHSTAHTHTHTTGSQNKTNQTEKKAYRLGAQGTGARSNGRGKRVGTADHNQKKTKRNASERPIETSFRFLRFRYPL